MRKKRPEWPVRLYPYHFKKDHHMIPRVWVPRTYDLEALIDALVADRSELSREALRSAAYQLVNKAIEQLVEGYAVSTPLGTLTPTVTGLWNFNRLSPDARAQNKASVSFSMSVFCEHFLIFSPCSANFFCISLYKGQNTAASSGLKFISCVKKATFCARD